MSYAQSQFVPWPVPPDWSDGVSEQLEWYTDRLQARNGRAQKRELRRAPRRLFEFQVIADGQARRVLDTLLNDHGGREWLLPIWHDIALLNQPLASGALFISCVTAGRDFVEDSLAVLWLSINEWAVVQIDAVQPDGVTIGIATSRTWPAGTRLYPARRARLVEQPEEAMWTDASGSRVVKFIVTEPCEWPAILPSATYRGLPVLEMRPDQGEDLPSVFQRQVETIDAGTGVVNVFDWPNRSFREAALTWLAHGRDENSVLRSLLYALRGRMATVWVPTWNADLQLAADVTAVATNLTVEWAGYTTFGRMQPNWRDIRVELLDGTVLYRRITSAQENGNSEVLGIDSAFGRAIKRSDVRAISFLILAEQASDRVELAHVTDAGGITVVTTTFRGVRHDV